MFFMFFICKVMFLTSMADTEPAGLNVTWDSVTP